VEMLLSDFKPDPSEQVEPKMSAPPTVIYLGASRGVGFLAYKRLASINPDVQSVLLVRSIADFKTSVEFASLDDDLLSRTILVEGDAHSEDDVRRLLSEGKETLTAIVFSIGYSRDPGFRNSVKSLMKGPEIEPLDLCTRALITLVHTLHEAYFEYNEKPKLVVVSSMGIGAHAQTSALSPLLRPVYSRMYRADLEDKLAMEVVLEHSLLPSTVSASFPSTRYVPRYFPSASEVNPNVLSEETLNSLPGRFIQPPDVCVVRPAILTNAKPRELVRVAQENEVPRGSHSFHSIGREDVAGFIADLIDGADENVTKWWGHQVVLAY